MSCVISLKFLKIITLNILFFVNIRLRRIEVQFVGEETLNTNIIIKKVRFTEIFKNFFIIFTFVTKAALIPPIVY